MLARSKYYIHSPFVFEFYKKVLIDNKTIDTSLVNTLRSDLLKDKRTIDFIEYGAGSKIFKNGKRKIKDIVKYNAISAKQGAFLSRLIQFLKPKNILEFGTSLGFSSIYMALAKQKNTHIYTMEGDENLCEIASENFKKIGINDISIMNDEFDMSIKEIIKKDITLDVIYFDGNHQKKASLKYFNDCLPLINENSVFIFDDIRWTKDMLQAWEEISSHPKVSVSIDLFSIGLVFFRNQVKEDFKLIL
jgi:predicted O-methyltransferase YrrM